MPTPNAVPARAGTTMRRPTTPQAEPEPIPPLRPQTTIQRPTGPVEGMKSPGPGVTNLGGAGINPITTTNVPPAVPAGTATLQPRGGPETFAPQPSLPAVPARPATPSGNTPGSPFTLSPTDPNNALTAQTIGAGPGLDRFQIAQQQYDNFVSGTDPAYQAALRDASRQGAAMGGIGSGMLRSRFGDLATDRTNALGTERRGLFTDALLGSVDDARFATGLAERQQGFQSGQQRDAFANELARMGIGDQLTNSDFNRALQTWLAGNTGGTGSGTMLTGANTAGNNAADSWEALRRWMESRSAAPGPGMTVPPGTVVSPPLPQNPGNA